MKHKLLISGLLALALAFPVISQNRSRFAGRFNAADYAYGYASVGTFVGPLTVLTGTAGAAAGNTSVVVNTPWITLSDGTIVYPLAVNAPIVIGVGANAETVTLVSVSGCNYNSGYGGCTITGPFLNGHGTGDTITSSTVGLQEAVNAALAYGGGLVDLDSLWTRLGGTNAMISAAAAFSSVTIEDMRAGANKDYSMQPSTLSLLAIPATLTAATATWTATPVGTWTAAPQFICITYVDALGGESTCNAVTYSPTPTVSYTLNIAAAAAPASAGAVGWRLYGGITSQALAYLAPITSANCTLTTLETVVPACAIGSAGVFSTMPLTTGQLAPAAIVPLQNVNNPVLQGHNAFAYQPVATASQSFQTAFGPFPAVGTVTAGNFAVLGSFQLPAGYLNTIGRTIRVSGKITATVTTADTFSVIVGMVWPAGVVAGLPTAVCSAAETATLAATVVNVPFTCTMTANAAGATAVGSLQPNIQAFAMNTGGGIAGIMLDDTPVAAVGTLGLFAQDTFYVKFGSIAQTASAAQLLDLHIETIQ